MTANIFTDIFGDSVLNIVYALALFIGTIYAIFLVFFQGIGDALGDLDIDLDFDADLDMDADAASEAAGISVLAIASFISSFGAFGLIAVTLFDAGPIASLIVALLGGIVIGIAAQFFFLYILSPTISSEVQQTKLIGIVAEITTPIPANGVGQIAFVAKGSRVTCSARATESDLGMSRGTAVRIERIVGGMAYVSEIS